MGGESDAAEVIAQTVRSNSKYREISEGLVIEIARREAQKRQSVKEAVKSTKNKLHQVAGAYLVGQRQYDKWLGGIEGAYRSGDREAFLGTCKDVMGHHASTRERIGFVGEFYSRVLEGVGPVRSVLDVACGLNPLAIPWMGVGEGVAYYAYDIYTDLAEFLNGFFKIVGVEGYAYAQDVIATPPEESVDLALVLKTIPCLEQVDKEAGRKLLDSIKAETLVVSFPLYSLGGRQRGMGESYSQRFEELTAGKGWKVSRFDFPTELVFRVNK